MSRDRLTALPPLAHTSQHTCLACPNPTDRPYCSDACRRRNNGGVPIIRPVAAPAPPTSPVRPRPTSPLRGRAPTEDVPASAPAQPAPPHRPARALVVLGEQHCRRCGFPHQVYGYPADELDA